MDVSNDRPAPGRPEAPPEAAARSAALDRAATQSRQRLDARWVEVSDQIVATALTARRRTRPLRAEGRSGPVYVSDQVVVSDLRATIDGAVRGSAVAQVDLEVRQDDRLAGVVVQLVAQYGVALVPMADRVRELTRRRLAELLGPVPLPVTVRTMRVHFRDVTREDPNPRA
ncbi:MAG: hypothetical protein ABIW80_05365 [Lapillicoccus sp.]